MLEFGSEKVVKIVVGKLGGSNGQSKNAPGGYKYADRKAKEVLVWRMDQLDGKVTVLDDFLEYMELLKDRSPDSNFLASINQATYDKTKFFKTDVNLGEQTIGKYITHACDALGIKGLGTRDHITAHGLRATVITQLFEMGQSATCVQLRSGHKSIETLKEYRTLRGQTGKLQQEHIFADPTCDRPSKKPKHNDVEGDPAPVISNPPLSTQQISAEPNVTPHLAALTPELKNLISTLCDVNNVTGGITINININPSSKM